jgi:hypothetical protein
VNIGDNAGGRRHLVCRGSRSALADNGGELQEVNCKRFSPIDRRDAVARVLAENRFEIWAASNPIKPLFGVIAGIVSGLYVFDRGHTMKDVDACEHAAFRVTRQRMSCADMRCGSDPV